MILQVITIEPMACIVVCGLLLGMALCLDVKRHTIPNWLTLPACLAGIGYHMWVRGPAHGAMFSFQGLGMGLAVLLVPFLMGGMGGGDVKFLAALGSWLGPGAVFNLFLYAAMAGGGIALVVVMVKSGFQGIRQMFAGLFLDLLARQKPRVDRNYRGLPYAIPMAVGYGAYLLIGRIV